MATPTMILVIGKVESAPGVPDPGARLTFERSVTMTHIDGTLIEPRVKAAEIAADGSFSTPLEASTDPAWLPVGFTYQAVLRYSDQRPPVKWSMQVPHNASAGDITIGEYPPPSGPPSLGISYAPVNHTHSDYALVGHTHDGGGGGSGVVVLPEQGTPPAAAPNQISLYAVDLDSNTVPRMILPEGVVIDPIRDTSFVVRNASGATIPKGVPVYPTGVHPGAGVIPTVAPGRANAKATCGIIGVTLEPISNNSFGRIMVQGRMDDVNTSGLTAGAQLYLSHTVAGGMVTAIPPHPNYQILLGVCLRSNATTGALAIQLSDIQGDGYGSAQNSIALGNDQPGTKTLQFKNGFTGSLSANPTAARTWTLPDSSGPIGMSPMVWNGSAYVEAPLGRPYIGPVDPGAMPEGSIWIDTDS